MNKLLHLKKFNRKHKVIFLSAVAAVLAAVGTAGLTLALLQKKTDAAANDFAGGTVNIGVIENGTLYQSGDYESGNVNDRYQSVDGGAAVAKTVAVQNIDGPDFPTTDTYVRVRLVPMFVYDAGTDYAGQTAAVDIRGKVHYTYGNTADWKYSGSGDEKYYYYTKVLRPGEISGNLIESVTFTGEVPEETHLELKVLAEGIAANQTLSGKSSLSVWNLTDFESLSQLP